MDLKQIYLFSHLDDELIKIIEKFSVLTKYSKDNIIFYEGDDPKYLHLLVSGVAKLYKSTTSSKQIVLKYFYQNELIAELANFENLSYPATCVAFSECEVLKVDFVKLKEIIYKDMDLVFKIQASLIKKIKNLEGVIASQLVLDTTQRVAKYIVENEDEFFRIKNVLIAQMLNMSPETFSRVLRNFKDEGLIDMENKRIKAKDLILFYN